MKSIVIEGPARVSGVITPGGNKNAALPIIAAAILTRDEVVIHNMPVILDVEVMLDLARDLGASVRREGSTVVICARDIDSASLPPKKCAALRASFIFGGAVAARCGESFIGLPGGDFIGRRRLDSHFYGLEKLGIGKTFDQDTAVVHFQVGKGGLSGADIFLDEASVTATEHILIAAVLAKGKTVIRNAAAEPHVQQLAEFLNLMGAKISGIDSNTLFIEGVSELHGAEFTLDSDHIEAASFLAMAAATGGGLEITGKLPPSHYWMAKRVYEKFNIKFRFYRDHIILKPDQNLRVQNDFGSAIPTISDGPWPQFPSDMMSCMIVAATQARGTCLFFEKMFESRIYFVDRLIAMGANAIVCDPHRVVISGPSTLHGGEMSSPDIRAGMAMIVAAAIAHGRSVIHNADMIFRGYENLLEKLAALSVNAKLEET